MELSRVYKQINIYCDSQSNDLYMVPNGELSGLGIVEIEHVENLSAPFEEQQLLHTVKRAIDLCYSKTPALPRTTPSALGLFLGLKNYGTATKDKKLIVLTWENHVGYILYPTMKHRSGGYDHMTKEARFLGEELSDERLAEAIEYAIERSCV
ncbi:hypothetical protein FHS18_003648 [Paenibacillus phyllosphaerae]|uniref:DUF1436 family protein n=1 Tax=Paenibacillus phyllosphaerae TaxID=274593 RepID=A0A7W5FNR5_9BACL|nr:hypothetical protein [Paenibacillus phyllosphaerae]MBB3111580.1 hypothetical protein [Paenibacillus phyllosphaerae]